MPTTLSLANETKLGGWLLCLWEFPPTVFRTHSAREASISIGLEDFRMVEVVRVTVARG